MSVEQARDILLQEGLFALYEQKAFGISIEEVFSHILDILSDDILDKIVGYYLRLERMTFLVDPNDPNSQRCFVSDVYYRSQAKVLIPTVIPGFLKIGNTKTPHTHSWANYIGFTQTFEYCTICDEKKK